MKNYPRLHSLSTLGLIHHQECDYIFHPSRTDFMGDSASGKSIVADLLQLIFVGSTVFKSSTSTIKEPRDPDGLVLKTSGKGTDIAYAFINIEMADEQFITIGAYLESVNKYTKPFIIQSSIEIENDILVPMSIPLQAADLKNGDDVFALDELQEIMDNRDLVFSRWDRFNAYHRILYNNGILPLDLAASEKTLKDYAQIIQSFSRGKDLKINDSYSILNFLFSQEEGKNLNVKYNNIVKELEATVLSYGQNLESIKLLNRKFQRVFVLKNLLEIKRNAEKDYLLEELSYLKYEHDQLLERFTTNTMKFRNAFNSLKQLIVAAKKNIEYANGNKDSIAENVKRTLGIYNLAKQENDILTEALNLLAELKIEESELEKVYKNYKTNKEIYTNFESLKSKLSTNELEKFFQQSEWIKGLRIGNDYYINRKPQIQTRIEQLNRMSEYTDLGNPDSLANWAVSLGRPLTRIEESLVLHFQSLSRKKPDSPTSEVRYLPVPEKLFENEKIEENGDGFWINLDGIWEYVDYVQVQKLNTVDKSIIDKYFTLQSQSIKHEVIKLQEEQNKLDNINNILTDLSNATDAIMAYQKREELKQFKEIELLNVEPDRILSYITALQKSDTIIEKFANAQIKIDDAYETQNNNENTLNFLVKEVNEANILVNSITTYYDCIIDDNALHSKEMCLNIELVFGLETDEKIKWFQDKLSLIKSDALLGSTLKDEKEKLDNNTSALKLKKESYILKYNEEPILEETSITDQSVQNKQKNFIEQEASYNAEFNSIVTEFISNEAYRFESNKDFPELIAYLLPEVFGTEEIVEENVIDKVNSHLQRINDKNRALNQRKTQRIVDLLDEVKSAVSGQADIVRKINHFFNDGENRISGNYRMKLVNTPSKQFPINWLSDFKKKSDLQLDIFETSIAGKLSTSVSIQEKMLQAFSELTDNHNSEITISDLLNPNSYMTLNLEMQNASGKPNKGSTGQTYAAIALLCIARLSIVGRKKQGIETGIRFMPIDEAEGLGTNFDMLYSIAQKYDYQIITFAINPLGRYSDQYIYILHRNTETEDEINYTPMAIRSKLDIKGNLTGI